MNCRMMVSYAGLRGMLRDVKTDIPHYIPQVILLEGNELQRMRYVAGCYFYSLRAEKEVIRVYIEKIYIVLDIWWKIIRTGKENLGQIIVGGNGWAKYCWMPGKKRRR